VDALELRGTSGALVSSLKPTLWRELMSQGPLGRVKARLRGMVVFPLRSVSRAMLSSEDTVLVPTTNPFFLPALLVASRGLHGRQVVPLVYDMYPEAIEATGLMSDNSLFNTIAQALNRYWLTRSDAVVF